MSETETETETTIHQDPNGDIVRTASTTVASLWTNQQTHRRLLKKYLSVSSFCFAKKFIFVMNFWISYSGRSRKCPLRFRESLLRTSINFFLPLERSYQFKSSTLELAYEWSFRASTSRYVFENRRRSLYNSTNIFYKL